MSTAQKFHTDLERCLLTFTDLDVLDEDNKFICKSCTERKHRKNSEIVNNFRDKIFMGDNHIIVSSKSLGLTIIIIVYTYVKFVETGDFLDDDSNEAAYTLCRVSKQLMIHQLPPVLILHIKRFEIGHYRVTKDSRYVSFPEVLNLAPYCTVDCLKVCTYMHSRAIYRDNYLSWLYIPYLLG